MPTPTPPAPGTAPPASAAWTHRSGVGDVRGGVADDAVADQAVTREEATGADGGNQDLHALGKDPLHGHVTQDRRHRLLQRLDHLRQKAEGGGYAASGHCVRHAARAVCDRGRGKFPQTNPSADSYPLLTLDGSLLPPRLL